jgi:rSAM/selenodomain-associated transferase 2
MEAKTVEPTISIVVPVYGESDRIVGLINHLRRLDRRGCCEIIVVDGDPRGDTIAVIGDRDVIALSSQKGRARQMNAGAALARGETLLFLHADTLLPRDGIQSITSTMRDRSYMGGSFSLSFDSRRPSLSVLSHLASIRSRLTRLPFGDHAIFVRRQYFNEIGGYGDIPIMEDLELMRRIKKRGDKIKILKSRVTTSARRIEREGLVYCAIRYVALTCLYSFGASPQRLKRYYPDGEVGRDSLGHLRRGRDVFE